MSVNEEAHRDQDQDLSGAQKWRVIQRECNRQQNDKGTLLKGMVSGKCTEQIPPMEFSRLYQER